MNLKALPLLKLQQLPPEEPRLRINADGTLQIGRKDGQIEFAFHYLGLNFEANTRPTASGTVVQVVADIAPLPAFPPRREPAVRALPPMAEWTDVHSLGVKGDAETDDTAALQRAIDTHRVLYFPAGFYEVTDTLD